MAGSDESANLLGLHETGAAPTLDLSGNIRGQAGGARRDRGRWDCLARPGRGSHSRALPRARPGRRAHSRRALPRAPTTGGEPTAAASPLAAGSSPSTRPVRTSLPTRLSMLPIGPPRRGLRPGDRAPLPQQTPTARGVPPTMGEETELVVQVTALDSRHPTGFASCSRCAAKTRTGEGGGQAGGAGYRRAHLGAHPGGVRPGGAIVATPGARSSSPMRPPTAPRARWSSPAESGGGGRCPT